MSTILEVRQRLPVADVDSEAKPLVLDHLQREKGRFRASLEDGTEVRVFLERGNPLRLGTWLRSDDGQNLVVTGAKEAVIRASTDDWAAFSRACYHLGNRHVRLQLGERWLQITPDHVLEELLQRLGLEVTHVHAVFEPEPGAYSGGGHGHHHH